MVVILTVTAMLCAFGSGMLVLEAFEEIRRRIDDWWTIGKFFGAAALGFAAWACTLPIHP